MDRKMFGFLALAVLSISTVEGRSQCARLLLSGTKYHKSIEGAYWNTRAICGGHLVWMRYDGVEDDYIYYHEDSKHFVVGSNSCGDTRYLRAYDPTSDVIEFNELEWEETNNHEWSSVSTVSLRCKATPTCISYYISGTREHSGFHGRYGKTTGTCSGLPIWRYYNRGSYDYLYYLSELGEWLVGPAKCSTLAYISAIDHTPESPSNPSLDWEEFLKLRSWTNVSSISVNCYDGVRPGSYANTASTSAPRTIIMISLAGLLTLLF